MSARKVGMAVTRGAIFFTCYVLLGALLIWYKVEQDYSGEASTRAFGAGMGWHTSLSVFAALAHAAVVVVFAMLATTRRGNPFALWLSVVAAVLAIALDYTRLPIFVDAITGKAFGQNSMWLAVTIPATSALASTIITLAAASILRSRAAHSD
jgi:hypothetical protein